MTKAATNEKKGKAGTGPAGKGKPMKFKTPQTTLAATVDRVLHVVPQKTTMPVLGHLHLQATDGSVEVTATDLDLTISTAFGADVASEGAVTLPAKRFSEIVRQLDPAADVELDIHDATAVITGGRANFRILGMGPEEFPKVPEMDLRKAAKVPAESLRTAIQKTVYSVSRDETRRALTGVLWEVAEDSMSMVGTDGHRLARISLPVKIDVDARKRVIVPTKALNQLLRLASEAAGGAVEARIEEDHAIFRVDKTSLFTRLIEGPFPKYEDVIPKGNDKRVIVKREALTDALRRVSLLSDTITHQVRLSLRRDQLVLSARTPDIGEAKEELEAQYGGEDLDIGFNSQYLGDVLRNIETDEVLMSLGTALNAALLEPLEQGEDENYLCLVMPLRLVD